MSKTERRDTTIWETRMRVFERDGWRCIYVNERGARCQKRATQLAHVLPQDVVHLARYGPAVIHHYDNLRSTCPAHNATVQINYRSRPTEADEHAARIRAKLQEETDG